MNDQTTIPITLQITLKDHPGNPIADMTVEALAATQVMPLSDTADKPSMIPEDTVDDAFSQTTAQLDAEDFEERLTIATGAFTDAWSSRLPYTPPEPMTPVAPETTEPTGDGLILDLTGSDEPWRSKLKQLGFHWTSDDEETIHLPGITASTVKTGEHWDRPDLTCDVYIPVSDTPIAPTFTLHSTTTGVATTLTTTQLMRLTEIKTN